MGKRMAWLIVVLWMLLIFYFSHQPVFESRELSTMITKRLIEIGENVTPIENVKLDQIHHFVRKNAHFNIYFFLGIFTMLALKISGVKGNRSVVIVLIICIIYAVTDEFHQLFVLGRGAQLKDVIIDLVGATTGIATASLIGMRRKSRMANLNKGL
ncbi:MAG: VanZ family protein [Solibacillus sp.]|uniref:VanZ family protein n=1 Tax=Solibacillus sp. TaxID=1909654 RepID=UPI003314C716